METSLLFLGMCIWLPILLVVIEPLSLGIAAILGFFIEFLLTGNKTKKLNNSKESNKSKLPPGFEHLHPSEVEGLIAQAKATKKEYGLE